MKAEIYLRKLAKTECIKQNEVAGLSKSKVESCQSFDETPKEKFPKKEIPKNCATNPALHVTST